MKKIKLCTLVASLVLGGSLHAGLYVKFDNLKGLLAKTSGWKRLSGGAEEG
jgi:hypothetical protein